MLRIRCHDDILAATADPDHLRRPRIAACSRDAHPDRIWDTPFPTIRSVTDSNNPSALNPEHIRVCASLKAVQSTSHTQPNASLNRSSQPAPSALNLLTSVATVSS